MSSGSDDFNDDSPQSGSHKQFKFTISNGVVTQVHEFKDGSYESKSIDADDIYTVGANGVVEHRELKLLGTEITRYADVDSDGVYNRISEQWIGSRFVLKDDLKYSPTDGQLPLDVYHLISHIWSSRTVPLYATNTLLPSQGG